MSHSLRSYGNNDGSALLIAMLILSVLTIIGIAVTRTTNIELQIAGNDRLNKKAFYEAESGAQIGWELIEQNLSCPLGFSNEPQNVSANLVVTDKDFALQEHESDVDLDGDGIYPEDDGEEADEPENLWSRSDPDDKDADPSLANSDLMDDERDILYTGLKPIDLTDVTKTEANALNEKDETPRTNIVAWGNTKLAAGSAIQMASGYEGKAKSAAIGGAIIAYQIHAKHEYRQPNSHSHIVIVYRHLVGQEGDCEY